MKYTSVIITMLFLLLVNGSKAQDTWYTLTSGDWNDATIWTLDPAGAVPVGSAVPSVGDNVVIKSGKTVVVPDGVAPYDVANNLSLTCGTVTINGQLDIRTSTGHTFGVLKGNGRLLMASDNYPTVTDDSKFVASDGNQGTVVFYGNDYNVTNSYEFYNVEIDHSTRVMFQQNLTVNGNLVVKNGDFRFGDSGNISVNVNGDVIVESGGQMSVTTGATNYHWLNIYGDFINSGTVVLSNTAQYANPTDGAVKVKFLGSTDNVLTCNGTTDLHRLFVDKGSIAFKLLVSASNSSNFRLLGQVTSATSDAEDGAAGWQRSPLVIESGTLELGGNIVINRIAEKINGTSPNEFTIPEGSQLWINGASVTTGNAGVSWDDNDNGLSLLGRLKVSSGSFSCPQYSSGISYYTTISSSAVLDIEGGSVNIPQLVKVDVGATFIYRQSGGNLNFNVEAEQNTEYPTYDLSEANSVFAMSGGAIIFSEYNSFWDGDFKVQVSSDNYDVTGGTVEIQTTSEIFEIVSTIPLYNLMVSQGTGAAAVVVDYAGGIDVLNDFTIGSGATFNDAGYDVSIGGVFNIAGAYSQTGGLLFNGEQDGAISNNTGSTLTLPGLRIAKDIHTTNGQFYKVSLSGADNIEIDGTLKLSRGALDVVDFWPLVNDSVVIVDGDLTSSGTGGLVLSGASQQVMKGATAKEQNFGNISLNNGNNGVSLVSNINVNNFSFATTGTAKVNLGAYNLDVAGTISNDNGADRHFVTNGTSAAGGLTMQFTVPSGVTGSIVTFPVGSTEYSPLEILTTSGASVDATGSFTVIPVSGAHPSTDPNKVSDVIPYYWKTKVSGFETLDDNVIRLEFTSSHVLKNLKTAYIGDTEWIVGTNKYGNNEYTLIYDNTAAYGTYSNLIASDYTAGLDNGNGQIPIAGVKVYTSQGDGNWHTAATWLDQDLNTGIPTESDIAIVQLGHKVTIAANNALASQVQINGTLYVNSGTSGHTINILKGNGRLVYENTVNWYSSYSHINGDHTEFCNSTEAIIEYLGSNAGPHIIPADLPYYPNLTVTEGTGNGTQTNAGLDLIVNGDLTVSSGEFYLDGNYDEYISVSGDVVIDAGTLRYESTGIRYMEVGGDITFTGVGTYEATGGTQNFLYLQGSILQGDGAIDFASGNLAVYFQGDTDALYSSNGNVASFYRLVNAKSTGVKVDLTADFTLSGPTNGTNKALQLVSGDCYINHADINIDLTTGGGDFNIPEDAKLYVTNGVVDASGNSGVALEGSLIINGGTANLDGTRATAASANSSFVSYTSSGSAYLEVSNGGTLNVGDQLRRSSTTDVGVLSFVQNGGTVNIGTVGDDMENTRGIVEVMGTGSSFTQGAGDVINIFRSNGSATVPTLYFDPETVTYGSGSGFVFDVSNDTDQVFGVLAQQSLNDVTITGGAASGTGSGNSVVIGVISHTIGGALTIGANTTFDANGKDLYLQGDLTNNGTFTANSNTTYFTGTVDQTITGSTTFANVVKQTGTASLIQSVATPLTITGDLTLSSGTLNTGENDLTLLGDLTNNATTVSTGVSQGIIMGATADIQQVNGSGAYSVLTINNSNGVVLPTQSGAMTFSDKLRLVDGVFDIGRNLLVIEEGASIEEVNAFSETNMIQTNLSFTDNGIKKYFPVIAASEIFTYPIGSLGKYTPIVFDIATNGNNTGSIRVKAADEPHVSVPVADQGSVLQYNWTLDANGIEGFSASAQMFSNDGDAPGDTAQYITARILLGSTDWNKFTTDEFHGRANDYDILLFSFSNTNDAGIDGDYTAGVATAIPDEVPAYITVQDGNYADVSTWATYDPDTGTTGAQGVDVPAGGPRGSLIYIDHNLLFADNFESAYRTYINATGIANIGTTYGHRLGDVHGVGKLRVERGDVPAGSYDDFFSATGGTLEYGGTTDYDILSELPLLNNLVLSGTGDRRLPNIDVQLYGDLTIDGADVINIHNSSLYLKGDVSFLSGTFDAGISSSTFGFNGTTTQTVSGTVDFTSAGGGEFFNLDIDNAVGVQVTNNLEVSNQLLLTDGIIGIDPSGEMTLTNSSENAVVQVSTASFVDGLLNKNILNSGSFDFPIGNASRYGNVVVTVDGSSGGVWSARYYNSSPASASKDPTSVTSPVEYVSHNEFWHISSPTATSQANMLLRWDSGSGVTPDANFRVVKWNATTWEELAIGTKLGDNSAGTVDLSSNLLFSASEHFVTFGSVVIPLYDWVGGTSGDWFDSSNWSGGIVPSAGSDITIANTGTAPYVKNTSEVAQVNDLTINHTGGLIVQPGGQMTINGDLTTNNLLTIDNTNAQPASLITNGTVTGDVNIKWTYDNLRWWFIGHGISNPTTANYEAIRSPQGNDYALYDFLDDGSYFKISDNLSFNLAAEHELKGYLFKVKDAGAYVTHTGTINNDGVYTKALQTDWQILANPYPAYYQLPKQDAAGADFENTTGTVYVTVSTRDSDKSFETFNTLTGLSSPETFTGILAPNQAFYLQTTAGNVGLNVTMRAANRLHDVNKASLKSGSSVENDVIRIKLSNEGGGVDEAVIALLPNGDFTFNRMDSEQRFNTNSLSYIYSIVDDNMAVINVLPEEVDAYSQPIGIGAKAGIHRLYISGVETLTEGYELVLEDTYSDVFTRMNRNTIYEFESEEGTFNDRFVLHFKAPQTEVPTGIEGVEGEDKVQVYVQDGSALIVNCSWDLKEKSLAVYTVSGSLVMKEQFEGEVYKSKLNVQPGIYIVKVTGGNKSYEQKLFVD